MRTILKKLIYWAVNEEQPQSSKQVAASPMNDFIVNELRGRIHAIEEHLDIWVHQTPSKYVASPKPKGLGGIAAGLASNPQQESNSASLR
jgi:hypothetical protein